MGSPGGNLTLDQVSEALGELGVEATDLRAAVLQPRGVALAFASSLDGHPLMVKVFGRDAYDGQVVAAAWSAIWNRGAKPVGRGRLQQVEHEALVSLLAERGGVPVLPVVAAGQVAEGDALLVLEADARPYGSFAADEIDDHMLGGWWRILGKLHELGVSHGRVDADRTRRAFGRLARLHRPRGGEGGRHRVRAPDRPGAAARAHDPFGR